MRILAFAAAFVALTLISGCGGGSSGGGSSPAVPTINVTLSATSGSVSAVEGTSATVSVTATAVSTVPTSTIADLTYDKTIISSVTATAGATAGSYSVSAATLSSLRPGTYSTPITFRLCKDASCATVYQGSSVTYTLHLTVKPADWSTYQGNALHTGFVDITLDPTKFAKAWTWNLPVAGTYATAINSVATGNGHVFVSKDDYNGLGYVYALDEKTGAVAWTANLGNVVSEGPPAYANGKVYVNVIDSGNGGKTLEIDAKTGTMLNTYRFSSGGNVLFPPVIANNTLYTTSIAQDPRFIVSVFYIGIVNAYALDGSKSLSQGPATGGSRMSQTLAVDGTNLYYYSTPSWENYTDYLDAFDQSNLTKLASISDTYAPFQPPNIGGSTVDDGYYGAPIIADTQTVLSYSGANYSGALLSSAEPLYARSLVSFNRKGNTLGWKSANAYLTTPAVAKNVAYVARNNPGVLEALDVSTGAILWSWNAPAADAGFHRNIVAVNNLIFVSTDKNVYAIDTTTHQQVWSYGAAGQLAISSDLNLYIATGATVGDGGLVAIQLH